jgi:hypothetical protein
MSIFAGCQRAVKNFEGVKIRPQEKGPAGGLGWQGLCKAYGEV